MLLHGGVYTASRFLTHSVAFLMLPLYARLLGSDGVGVIEVLNVMRTFLFVVFMQGLDAAWFRFRFGKTGPALRAFESTIIWYLLGASLAGMLLVFLLGARIAAWISPGLPFVPLGLYSAFSAFALMFGSLLERRFQAEQRPLAFAVWSLLRTTGGVLAIVLFVAVWRRGAAGKVEAEAVASGLVAVVALAILRPGLRATRRDLGEALRYGWPLVPHSTAGVVNDMVDRFLLNAMLGLGAVGVYSMGYRIAGAGMVVMTALNQAFAPVFIETVRRAEQKDAEQDAGAALAIRKQLASLGFFNVLVGCVVALGVGALAREVLALATTEAFRESWRVVAPVSASVVAWTWYSTLSQSVTYRSATVHRLPLITLAAATFNVAVNYALIPRFGIDGAAWATLLSNSVMAAGAVHFGTRSLPLPYAFGRWIAVSAWTGAGLFVLWHLDARLPDLAPRLLAKLTWLAVALGILLLVSGVRPSQIKRWLVTRGRPTDLG